MRLNVAKDEYRLTIKCMKLEHEYKAHPGKVWSLFL